MKRIITIFSFLAFLVTTACIMTFTFPRAESGEFTESHTEKSTYPDIEIETEIGEYEKYKYAIHFPKTQDENINESLKQFVSEQKEDFLRVAKTLKPTHNNYSELLIDYDITYLSEQLLSIVFHTNAELFGQSEKTHTVAFNFNRQSGQSIGIDTLISNETSKEQFISIVQNQLFTDPEITSLADHFEWDFTNYHNFYFASNSLFIEFGADLIATTASQSYILEIPFNQLTSIIDERYAASLVQISENNTELLSDSTKEANEEKTKLVPGEKYIALTFDDGPHNERTPYILDVLKKYDVPATFYVLGNRAEYYPEIVKRAYDEGHEIGNHTWSHPKLTALSEKELLNQINRTSNLITSITGEAPATLRPPYGAFNDTVRTHIQLPIINWSVDTLDWKHKNKEKMLDIIRNTTNDGSIVLMHDIHQATADAIEEIILELKKQDYHFVTVSTLLDLENTPAQDLSPVYTNRTVN